MLRSSMNCYRNRAERVYGAKTQVEARRYKQAYTQYEFLQHKSLYHNDWSKLLYYHEARKAEKSRCLTGLWACLPSSSISDNRMLIVKEIYIDDHKSRTNHSWRWRGYSSERDRPPRFLYLSLSALHRPRFAILSPTYTATMMVPGLSYARAASPILSEVPGLVQLKEMQTFDNKTEIGRIDRRTQYPLNTSSLFTRFS